MEKKVFLYTIMHMNNRHDRRTGMAFGVIHAESEEQATQLLVQKAGIYAYAYRLLDVTDCNGEGFIGIPNGELIAFEQA